MISNDILAQSIISAFSSVRYPGDDNLTDSAYGPEPAALRKAFRGKTDWRKLDASFIDGAPDGYGSALSFFTRDAFRFFLPSYLLADIRGELSRSDPAASLCIPVTPLSQGRKVAKVWGGGTGGDHASVRFAVFDCKQVLAIVAYLWWCLDRDGYQPTIEQALEHFWLDREAACVDTPPDAG